MQVGIIGLGRTGANVALRFLRGGHRCVVFDPATPAVEALAREGATGFGSAKELVMSLQRPRVIWLMLPADAIDATIETITPILERGDTLIDAGNSHYQDDIRRARALARHKIGFVDVGVSSGTSGLARGYCLMVGGDASVLASLKPLLESLSSVSPDGSPGCLHCGSTGAGHFVKMVHDGIEHGLMEAYAEGLNILRRANAGIRAVPVTKGASAEQYRYDFDVRAIAEVWRRGSAVESSVLDLASAALAEDPEMSDWGSRASYSAEARGMLKAALSIQGPAAPAAPLALAKRLAAR